MGKVRTCKINTMPLPPDLSKPSFAIVPEAADRVIRGECVICRSLHIRNIDFRDNVSRQEYSISGLCQKCQDKVFGHIDWDDADEMFE